MTTAYITVTLIAIAANGFSGTAALLHLKPILPGMAKAGVPISWLTFPIGTLKTAGALGLAAGLAFRPLGVAAAIGLVLFFGSPDVDVDRGACGMRRRVGGAAGELGART